MATADINTTNTADPLNIITAGQGNFVMLVVDSLKRRTLIQRDGGMIRSVPANILDSTDSCRLADLNIKK